MLGRSTTAAFGFSLIVTLAGGCDESAVEGALASGDLGQVAPDGGGDPGGVAYCEGATAYLYDPVRATEQLTYPDDYYLVDDASTVTGKRVSYDADSAPWLASQPDLFRSILGDLSALDGFGTNAAIVLRFDAPLDPETFPSGESSAAADSPVRILDLGPLAEGGEPVAVPFETKLTDDDRTAMLWPMRPLRPATAHGVVVSDALTALDGGCIAPSPTLRRLLEGEGDDARLQALVPRYAQLVEAAGLEPAEVSAAVVFTTQSIVETSVAIAEDIAKRSYEWAQAPVCEPGGELVHCEGTWMAYDYRRDGVVVEPKPQREYELHVAIWLPADVPGPWPVVLFGHGLEHGREAGGYTASVAGDLGFATVCTDAVAHGDHPDAPDEDSGQLQTLAFFEVQFEPLGFDSLKLRDNFRQSTYDKLQLMRLLDEHRDIDGDGVDDLDFSHYAYIGESFGGIMGPELLAVTNVFQTVVLEVPGASVSRIVSEGKRFSIVMQLMKPPGSSTGDMERAMAVIQTLLERGDPANYAPYLLGDRLPIGAGPVPNMLSVMGIGDATIPNESSHTLARAMDIPQVAPVREPIGLVPIVDEVPFSGNIAGGAATAGVTQFDRETRDPGKDPEPADHDYLPSSVEVEYLVRHFLQTWLDSGVPEIIDPYVELGTPELK